MKQEYTKPTAKMVKFHFNDQVTANSGGVGGYGSLTNIGKCQQSSETCSYFYTRQYSCANLPIENPGYDGELS